MFECLTLPPRTPQVHQDVDKAFNKCAELSIDSPEERNRPSSDLRTTNYTVVLAGWLLKATTNKSELVASSDRADFRMKFRR